MSTLRRTTQKQGPPGPPGTKHGTPTNWTPGTIVAGAFASVATVCTGAITGYPAWAAWATVLPAGLVMYAQVTAADQITVYLFNLSGSDKTVSAGTVYAEALIQ